MPISKKAKRAEARRKDEEAKKTKKNGSVRSNFSPRKIET